MVIVMFKSFEELSGIETKIRKKLVVAAAHDSHTLEAVYIAAEKFRMRYILVGDREKIMSFSSELGVTPDMDTIINSRDDADCAFKAVTLIREGDGDALMKGLLDTGTILKAVLDKESGIRGYGTLSHMAILEVPGYHKLIGITDGGMIPNPTLEQKADIARNATQFYQCIGYESPKIAALCASESISPKMQDTVDAAELKAMCRRGELRDCQLEGPLSFDIALSSESAAIKGFSSQISGETDILLVPGITVGNVLSKSLVYCAGATMAGCIIGGKTPIVLTTRGATTEEKLLSILLSIIGGRCPQRPASQPA